MLPLTVRTTFFTRLNLIFCTLSAYSLARNNTHQLPLATAPTVSSGTISTINAANCGLVKRSPVHLRQLQPVAKILDWRTQRKLWKALPIGGQGRSKMP
jgi:hypothetical protein